MRFRQKLPVTRLICEAIWIALTGGWVHRAGIPAGTHSMYQVSLAFWIFLTLWTVLSYLTCWWVISADGIHERRIWSTRFVPWEEVQRIGPYQPSSKPLLGMMEITYARTGPLSDRGSMVLRPGNRQQLLASLQSHLPPTAFEV